MQITRAGLDGTINGACQPSRTYPTMEAVETLYNYGIHSDYVP